MHTNCPSWSFLNFWCALEYFHKLCSVFDAKNEALAVGEGDGLERRLGSHE